MTLSIAIAQTADRGDQEPDHHELDDQIRVLEQLPDRKRRGGRLHGISFRLSSSSASRSRVDDRSDGPSHATKRHARRHRLRREDPKLRENRRPPPVRYRYPAKGVQTRARNRRPERSCADWVNARLPPRQRARLHRQKPGTASICPKCPHAVAAPAMQIGPPTRRGTARTGSRVEGGFSPAARCRSSGPTGARATLGHELIELGLVLGHAAGAPGSRGIPAAPLRDAAGSPGDIRRTPGCRSTARAATRFRHCASAPPHRANGSCRRLSSKLIRPLPMMKAKVARPSGHQTTKPRIVSAIQAGFPNSSSFATIGMWPSTVNVNYIYIARTQLPDLSSAAQRRQDACGSVRPRRRLPSVGPGRRVARPRPRR